MRVVLLLAVLLAIGGCSKDSRDRSTACNINATYAGNELKVSITNGVWGTVSSMEGDCMPMVDPAQNLCTHCPVKRTVRIYEYTNRNQATPSGPGMSFYTSFSTALIKEIVTDEDGFYQTELPAGHYTIVTIEDGKLHASGSDGQGGLNPITVVNGRNKVNLVLTYKAVF